GFDSATVSPYLGLDALAPFLEWEGKGVWVLCRNSNPGAGVMQDLPTGDDGQPLFARVAAMIRDAPARADAGLVVGAPAASELAAGRAVAPALPLLLVGAGAQGGDAAGAVRASPAGTAVVSVPRSVLHGPDSDLSAAIRRRAETLRDSLN